MMKRALAGIAAILCLSGCDDARRGESPPVRHGRYVGVGTYPAGQLWSKMLAKQPADRSAATTADDQQIIVVVDSLTGEIRECGDLTGYCIGMNPWKSPPAQQAPVGLSVHSADLNAEAGEAAADAPTDRPGDKPNP